MTDELFEKLESLLFSSKTIFPKDLRIFVPSGNNYVYVNNGHATIHLAIHGLMEDLKSERGSVLDAFAKFEFVIFELLRFAISGAVPTKPVMEVVKALSPRQRINILQELKIIDNTLQNKLSQIIGLRNEFAHKFSSNEIKYNDKPIFERTNFAIFQKNLQETWDLLAQEYAMALGNLDLQPVIDKIVIQQSSQNISSSQDNTLPNPEP